MSRVRGRPNNKRSEWLEEREGGSVEVRERERGGGPYGKDVDKRVDE